jgi:UDP-glucose 6-dehydrogenase
LHEHFSKIHVLVCPEFLTARNAAHEAEHPVRTILGIADCVKCREEIAPLVLQVLPKSTELERICTPTEASLIKLLNNLFPPMKVAFANIAYDLAVESGCDPDVVLKALRADPRIGDFFMEVVHEGGRGAGGPCIPNNLHALAALTFRLFCKYSLDIATPEEHQKIWPIAIISSIQGYNQYLLSKSGKE